MKFSRGDGVVTLVATQIAQQELANCLFVERIFTRNFLIGPVNYALRVKIIIDDNCK